MISPRWVRRAVFVSCTTLMAACGIPGGNTDPRVFAETEENDANTTGGWDDAGALTATQALQLTGSIQAGDNDWFRVTLPAGTWDVRVTCPSPMRAAAADPDGTGVGTTFASCASPGRLFENATGAFLVGLQTQGDPQDYDVLLELSPAVVEP